MGNDMSEAMTTPAKMDEREALLPCPFCGLPGKLKIEGDHPGEYFGLGCNPGFGGLRDSCPCASLYYTSPIEELPQAIKAWNTRAALDTDIKVNKMARFTQWIKENKGTPYAKMSIAVHSYFEALTDDIWFGDDPYHDNESMKAALDTQGKEVENALKLVAELIRSALDEGILHEDHGDVLRVADSALKARAVIVDREGEA